jgi:hypothetical protein
MESKRLETAKKFIAYFTTLNIQHLDDVLAETYNHQFAPSSINPPGPFDKPGMLEYSSRLRNIMSGFPVVAKEYIESDNGVTVWATSHAIFHDHVKDDGISAQQWEYEGEYVIILTMDATGERIVRTIEFLDSKGTADKLMPLIKRANENRERKSTAERT